jgi:hypothetical protein
VSSRIHWLVRIATVAAALVAAAHVQGQNQARQRATAASGTAEAAIAPSTNLDQTRAFKEASQLMERMASDPAFAAAVTTSAASRTAGSLDATLKAAGFPNSTGSTTDGDQRKVVITIKVGKYTVTIIIDI